jgi:hypothetical protein
MSLEPQFETWRKPISSNPDRVAAQWRWARYDRKVDSDAETERFRLQHEIKGRTSAPANLGYLYLMVAIKFGYDPYKWKSFSKFMHEKVGEVIDCSAIVSREYLCERQRHKLRRQPNES